MDEEGSKDASPPADSGRAKRPPPTIDLEASEVSGDTQGTNPGSSAPPRRSSWSLGWPFSAAASAMLTAAVTGAVTAALVIAIAWLAGWPGETAPSSASSQSSASAVDTLAARVADIEARSARPMAAASDPTLASRLEALEKSVASLRTEIAGARAQSEKLAADLNAVKSASRESLSPQDIAAINERLSHMEHAAGVEGTESARQDGKPADDAWRPCSTFRFGRVSHSSPYCRRRNRSHPIRTR
jgi:hypothetical protein